MITTPGWRIEMRKERATWYWFTTNPQGGSFGSNNCGPKKSALRLARRGIPLGEPYTLVTNGRVTHHLRGEDGDA